jgi:NAD-dependent dihydropyrimidine dehydrogenase PreA subunit
MIFYFSATGNSKYAAEKIAVRTDDFAVSIPDAIKNGIPDRGKKDVTGFVFPVYYWGLPEIIKRFCEMPEVKNSLGSYVYCVITCGANTGTADKMLEKKLGRAMDYSYSLRMPDNYVILYDPCTVEKARKFLSHSDKELDAVCSDIASKTAGRKGSTQGGAKSLVVPYLYDICRTTKKFYADEKCVSCGKCVNFCPDGAIVMKNGKPEWVKNKCQHCTACINRCPAKAIQFGKNTAERNRYNIWNVIR